MGKRTDSEEGMNSVVVLPAHVDLLCLYACPAAPCRFFSGEKQNRLRKMRSRYVVNYINCLKHKIPSKITVLRRGKAPGKHLLISKHSRNHLSHCKNVLKSYYTVAVNIAARNLFLGKRGYPRNIFSCNKNILESNDSVTG